MDRRRLKYSFVYLDTDKNISSGSEDNKIKIAGSRA